MVIIHLLRDVVDGDVELVLVLGDRHLVLRLRVRPALFFIKNLKTSVRPKSYFFFIKTFENYTLGFSSPHSLQLNHSSANLASGSASVRRAVTELEPLEVLRVPSHVRKETIFVRSF